MMVQIEACSAEGNGQYADSCVSCGRCREEAEERFGVFDCLSSFGGATYYELKSIYLENDAAQRKRRGDNSGL
jgi:hypothetical protein